MEKIALDLMYLCACTIKKETPNSNRISDMQIPEIIDMAKEHKLSSMVAYSLLKSGVKEVELEGIIASSIRRMAIFDSERNNIFAIFEKEGIWYMPLKGVILQDLYPAYGLREMADNDILFDVSKADKVKEIMESLGYVIGSYGTSAHDTYFKNPILNFEMHRRLFDKNSEFHAFEYYNEKHDLLQKDENNEFGYHLSHEDFYIYFIAHSYKHYSKKGSGLRTLLDIYIYLNKYPKLEKDYIYRELGKLGLIKFEQEISRLAFDVLDGKELSSEESSRLGFIISSGVYGNRKNMVDNALSRSGDGISAKLKYIRARLRVPKNETDENYYAMLSAYPFFYEHRILLPFLPIYRIVKKWKRAKKELYYVTKHKEK